MVFAVVFVKVKMRADGVLQFMIHNHTWALQKGREVKGGGREEVEAGEREGEGKRERGRWREREGGGGRREGGRGRKREKKGEEVKSQMWKDDSSRTVLKCACT